MQIKMGPLNTLQNYIRILRDHRVTHLVCATDPTYKTEDIEHEGVRFTSIPFPDGSPPTQVCFDDTQHFRKFELALNFWRESTG